MADPHGMISAYNWPLLFRKLGETENRNFTMTSSAYFFLYKKSPISGERNIIELLRRSQML